MKTLKLIIFLLLATNIVIGQPRYSPTAGNSIVTNKPLGIGQPVPTDARSMFYDATNFVYRDYISTAEVLSYLNTASSRTGGFIIRVNTGGSLSGGGVITGGTTTYYIFKDGVADGNLIALTSPLNSILTGFVSGAGAIGSSDNVLTAIQKLDGNLAAAGTTVPVQGNPDLFIQRALGGTLSGDLGAPTATNWPLGMNEKEILYYNGRYHLFWDKKGLPSEGGPLDSSGGIHYRTSTTLLGLNTAPDTQIRLGLRYPTAIFENGMWHVWGAQAGGGTYHIYSPTINGLRTAPIADGVGPSVQDLQVRINPTGGYIASYKKNSRAGILISNSLYGPWIDSGYIFTDDQLESWNLSEQTDGAITPIGNKLFYIFGAVESHQVLQRIAMVEVNPLTYKVDKGVNAVAIVEPLQSFQRQGHNILTGDTTLPKIFDPTYLFAEGKERIFYTVNAADFSTQDVGYPGGWGYLELGVPAPTSRAIGDVVRLLAGSTVETSANIPYFKIGTPTLSSLGYTATTTGQGIYGYTNQSTIEKDWTLAVQCKINTLNSSKAEIVRVGNTTSGSMVELYIDAAHKVNYLIRDSAGTTSITGTSFDAITTNRDYTFLLSSIAGDVLFTFIDTTGATVEGSNNLTFNPGVVNEWGILNSKGFSASASNQLLATIKVASFVLSINNNFQATDVFVDNVHPFNGSIASSVNIKGKFKVADNLAVATAATNINGEYSQVIYQKNGAGGMAMSGQDGIYGMINYTSGASFYLWSTPAANFPANAAGGSGGPGGGGSPAFKISSDLQTHVKGISTSSSLSDAAPSGGIFSEGQINTINNIFIGNTSTPSTPTGGGIVFVQGGSLKYIGSSGTVTVIGVP